MSSQSDPAFVDAPAKPATMFYLSVLRAGAFAGIVATIVGFWGETNWFADLVSQLRIQIAIGLFVLTLLLALARRWWWFLICLIGFALNAIPIWPYAVGFVSGPPPREAVVAESERIRLMSLNVLTRNRKWDEVIESVREASPDFLILMEVDSVWQQVCEQELADDYAHIKFVSREDNFGIALLSKFPWSQIEVFNSQTLELPSIDVTVAGLGSKPLRIIATHPIPPMNQDNWNARNEQLLNVAERFDDSTSNLMAGDLNLSPWSPNFKRVIASGNLVDSAKPFGPTPTWYVFPTWIGGLKIDHVLTSDDVSVHQVEIGHDVGSDHRAVIVDFDF